MLLTPEQRDAVREDGHVCLVSCPGSGKTRVIVAKLLRCIEEVRGTARRVACITHTNAGADEIDSRLKRAAFSGEDQFYDVSTIHSFALQNIFRPFHRRLASFKNGFVLLTSDDERFHIKRAELMKKYQLRAFLADRFDGIQRNPDGSVAAPEGIPAPAGVEWCEWLDASAFTSLGDLVYHSCCILDAFPFVASALASRFAWLLVDEFQDSSQGQVHLFKAIFDYGRSKFFCVGDPNQSIFGFAGASPDLLNEFATHVSATTKHRLTGNFRSSQLIVDVAEKLCPSTPAMTAVGKYGNFGVPPTSPVANNPLEGILNSFLPAVTALGVPFGKVAILAPAWPSLFHLARSLRAHGLPVIGPGARPYKRTHIFSHLAEPLGAFIESPEPDIALAAQRALFFVITNLTNEPRWDVFSYSGRTVVCKVLQAAASAKSRSSLAVDWLRFAAIGITNVLLDAGFLPEASKNAIIDSAENMIADITERDTEGTLTVEELGIFARPNECVQLMTIHKSKGREFEAVAVIEAHDGNIPHFSVKQIQEHQVRQARYDEARRVTYVAATRAMRVLMIFTDTSDNRNQPTPFLFEMGLRP